MKNKRTLQIIVSVVFVLGVLGFISYAINQLQLNKDSKAIIDSNNAILDSFSNQFQESLKGFENIDSLKLETTKQTELTNLANSYASQIENSKNQLKPGINSPSDNNYRLAVSKLDSYNTKTKNLKDLLDTKVCFKVKYTAYSATLTSITDTQDAVARANSFEDSKTALNKLKTDYQDLIVKAKELEDCFALESLSDLRKTIADNEVLDKTSIKDYQSKYLDPLIELYVGEDYSKIGAFIDANSSVTVKLKLPALFDNTTELSITDKVIEDQIISIISI